MTTVTNQVEQIVNAAYKSIDGMTVAWGSNTTLTVTDGQVRDSTNDIDIIVTTSGGTTTINGALNGLNGLDTGSLAASTWYYVYVIADVTEVKNNGFIISTSAATPSMPFGYSNYKLIGFALTDGSSHFTKFTIQGTKNNRIYYHDTIVSVLASGSATSFTAVDLSAGVPAIDHTPVILNVGYTPNSAGDSVALRATGSSATTVPYFTGVVAAQKQTSQATILSALSSSLPKIDYKNSAASGATELLVYGFLFVA